MKHAVAKGRGAALQAEGRFESVTRERFDDDCFANLYCAARASLNFAKNIPVPQVG